VITKRAFSINRNRSLFNITNGKTKKEEQDAVWVQREAAKYTFLQRFRVH
jgi:hypothetical protein